MSRVKATRTKPGRPPSDVAAALKVEIARLLDLGLTPAEVAVRVGCTDRTVQRHKARQREAS